MRDHAVRRNWAVCCSSQSLCLLCHRYRDHRICPQAALADLAVATFHRGIKLEDLTRFIVAAPSMQGNQPKSGETLNVHLRQAFDLAGEPVCRCYSIWTWLSVTSVAFYTAGVPCGRLDEYSAKGKVSHKFKKHGVEAAKRVGINKAEIKMAARYATQPIVCILNRIVPS